MARRIVAPLVSLLAALLKAVTGYEVPQESLDTLAEAILIVIGIVGVLLDPKERAKDA